MRYDIILVAWTVALTALFYITSHAKADDYAIRGGAAIIDGNPSGASKYFGLRHETGESIAVAAEVGGYVDNKGEGRVGSTLFKLGMGVKPGPEVGVFAKMFVGPCVISSTDILLGGHYQFCSDLALGVRDKETFVSAGYMHISSAGLSRPNKGRDFIILEMGVRF